MSTKKQKSFRVGKNPHYKNPNDKPHPRSAYAHLPLHGQGLEGGDPIRKSHLTAAEKTMLKGRPLKFTLDDEQEWRALEAARAELLASYQRGGVKYAGPARSSKPHPKSRGADLPLHGIEHGGGTIAQIKKRAQGLWNPPKHSMLYGARSRQTMRDAPSHLIGLEVYEIRYRHATDGKDYSHEFETGVIMLGQPDGSIRIESATGKKLWEEMNV